jgi:hypothetical protein
MKVIDWTSALRTVQLGLSDAGFRFSVSSKALKEQNFAAKGRHDGRVRFVAQNFSINSRAGRLRVLLFVIRV